MNSELLVRKLNKKEAHVNERESYENMLTMYEITSRVDLFQHLELIKRAIRAWADHHQFSKCKIVRRPQESNEFYFQINDNPTVFERLDNVRFLQCRSNDEAVSLNDQQLEYVYDLILDKLFVEMIDTDRDHDLLWRIVFLQVQACPDRFRYQVFVQYHHTIADGISANSNFVLLMSLLADLLAGKQSTSPKLYPTFPGVEEIFEDRIKLPSKQATMPFLDVASFINPSRARDNSTRPRDCFSQREMETFTLFDLNSNRTFDTLSSMSELSKRNVCKNRRLIVEASNLLKTCKKKQVKLTSCLNTLLSMAFKKLYAKYGAKFDDIVWYNAVNLRRFKADKVSNVHLGYCVGGLFSKFENLTDDLGQFWRLAKEADVLFTNRIINDNDKYSASFSNADGSKNLFLFFGLSNIGILENAHFNDELLVVENCFTTGTMKPASIDQYVINLINTVDDKICWNVQYNCHFIDHYIIDDLITFYMEILAQVTSSNA